MAIDPGPPVPGNVLDDREHAALEQPLADRSGKLRDAARLGSIGPVADHRIRPGNRDVEHRKTIDRDAELFEVVGNQPRAEPRRTTRPAGPAMTRGKRPTGRGARTAA